MKLRIQKVFLKFGGTFFYICMFLFSCKTKKILIEDVAPPGPALVYRYLYPSTSSDSGFEESSIYFSWLTNGAKDKSLKATQVLASDEFFDRTSAAVLLLLDNQRHVIDQVRGRDGKPAEFHLNVELVEPTVVRAQRHIQFATLILEKACLALMDGRGSSPGDRVYSFDANGKTYKVTNDSFEMQGYGPLPKSIYQDNSLVVEFSGTEYPTDTISTP